MSNQRALVTGADGFIGSHLAELLVRNGYQVRALVQYNSLNSWGWLDASDVAGEMEIVAGDVRDSRFCEQLTQGIDVVFHLAALIAIPYSYVAPQSYIDTNVMGTLNICQSALSNGVGKVVHTSTSEVYGTARYVPIDEAHPLQPQSPYSASKIGADMAALSFHHSFGLPVTVVRPFNTYGPRQSARAIIPTVISQLALGLEVLHVGDTTPTRDFNYVTDTCEGFLLLSRSDAAVGKVVNVGSNTEISVAATIDLIKELMGVEAEVVRDEIRMRPSGSEVFRLVCDNSLVLDLVGYRPRYDLRAGLMSTIEWFSEPANIARYKGAMYNV